MTLEQEIWEKMRDKAKDGIRMINYVKRSAKFPAAIMNFGVFSGLIMMITFLYCLSPAIPLWVKIIYFVACIAFVIVWGVVLYPRIEVRAIGRRYLKRMRKELRQSFVELHALAAGNSLDNEKEEALRLRVAQHLVIKFIIDDISHVGLLAARIPNEVTFGERVDAIVAKTAFQSPSLLIMTLEL